MGQTSFNLSCQTPLSTAPTSPKLPAIDNESTKQFNVKCNKNHIVSNLGVVTS